ncbi:MAG TPA: hypothetical protein VI461_00580 [Chitinophagaceae bacterium]|nr:hypothetical protein [Chitinophagaceae bacterium]
MKQSFLLKISFTLSSIVFTSFFLFSQECSVEKGSLKGSYTGDCKNGKAHGKGKAIGTDEYEGDFKSGLPDGQGTYKWSSGNSYTGKFAKGVKDGKGTMIYKRNNAPDSAVTGFWKKDQYAGKYEKPWVVHYTSKMVTEVQVEVKKDGFNLVTFFVTNTSGGAATFDGGELQKLKVDDIQMTKGSHGRTLVNSDHAKKTETIIYDVSFPAYMKVTIGSEQVEIEFLEEGTYIINVRINQ